MATPQVFKRILAFEPVQWIASAVGAGYVLIVRWTSRIDRPAPPVPGPFIIAMWHGRLAMLHLLRFGELPLIALISGHRDGQLISKCAWHYNIKTVTGSSSRGGIGAARKLIRLAREGHCLFITPDGPRGPRMHVNESILDLVAADRVAHPGGDHQHRRWQGARNLGQVPGAAAVLVHRHPLG